MMAEDENYAFLAPEPDMQRGSLASHVADQLRRAIIEMDLPPGTMIDKARVCERLGVSRSPVAAAFARLEAEGMLDIIPQRGTMVSYVSFEVVREYVFIRRALEGETVRDLAQNRTPALLSALETNLEAQKRCADQRDKDRFHSYDLAFHELLTSALEFRRMKALVDSARNNLDRVRQMTNSMARIRTGIAEHAEIIQSIADRDGDRAVEIMHAHLDGIVTEMEGLRQERPDLFGSSTTPPHLAAIRDFGTNRR